MLLQGVGSAFHSLTCQGGPRTWNPCSGCFARLGVWRAKATEHASPERAQLVRMWEVAEPTSGLLGARVGITVQSSCFGQPCNQMGLVEASNGATKGNPDVSVQQKGIWRSQWISPRYLLLLPAMGLDSLLLSPHTTQYKG